MSAIPHPQRIHSVHVESIDGELCVYDTARQRVHALNHTAAFVWQRCDGRTSPVDLAAALAAETSTDDAEAVVRLTLQELAAAHLLAAPINDVAGVSRRDLLARGVAAAAIPAIYSIVAPTPIEAQSPLAGAPTLTSIAPNQGSAGTTVTVTLTGTRFIVGATTVTVAGGDVTVTNVVVSSSTSLTANFVLDPSAVAGARSVTVTTAGGTSGAQTFTVGPPAPPAAPTLISVAPNQGAQGSTVAVTLTGTNFVVGATTVNVSGAGVTVANVAVASSTSLTANFVLDAAAAVGPRTVTVTTAGGTSGAQTFTVNLAAPTLSTVAPSQGIRGTTVAVTLTGTNFVVGATTVNVSGTLVTVNTVVVSSSTSLTANFVIDLTATPGGRAVTVTTAGGTSGPQTFTVGLLAPTLTNVAPNLGIQGTTVAVTLTGTNFVLGATTVAVSGPGVTITGVTVVDNTSLTANFVLDVTAALGARNVTVTTAFGTSGAQTFTINPPPPTLTSISPNQGIRATTVAVTLTGTNFVVGATTVTVSPAGVTVTNVVVGSSTSLTANFVIDGTTTLGARSVTVTTAGGTTAAVTFTINAPTGTATFTFTPPGGVQTFTVPPGVTTLTVTAQGAQGGFGSPGGLGGSVTATLTVVPGEMLEVRVGGQGGLGALGGLGGFNGGGAGGAGAGFHDGGGGGASDIRRGGSALSNRVVVAGGGGGGSFSGFGGAGGGTTGGAGSTAPNVTAAGGGTQSAGGAGGVNTPSPANNGQPGASGTGGQGGPGVLNGAAGGGGGGGYFGGGGGAGGTLISSGTGGGGSSFPTGGTQGARAGNGEVTITW